MLKIKNDNFQPGDKVEIMSGALKGKRGVYLESENNYGGTLGVIRINASDNDRWFGIRKVYLHRLRRFGDIGDPNVIFKNRRKRNG